MKDKKDRINLYRLIMVLILMLLFIEIIILNNKTTEIPNYCEIYSEQELTSSHICYEVDCEREYSLNGTWIKESDLKNSCMEIKDK